MKRFNNMNSTFKLAMLGAALALAAGPVAAMDYYLCAGATIKTMPDGSSVPVWGYAEDNDGDLSNGCGNPITLPGPRLTQPVGDPDVTIHLRNDLAEPTSVVIPSLPMPVSTGTGPTWNDDTTGPRTTATQRVRSFGAEAAAAGGIETYSWTGVRPGTFLYHSGTLPQRQVYMGLYGPMTVDAAVGVAYNDPTGVPYDATAYDNEVVLFYSEIDPVLNQSISDGTYTTSINYQARWFLVNGEPYVPGLTADIPAGNAVVDPLTDSRSNTLIRFLSAAGETHVPVLQGSHMTIYAEDALLYTWQDGATGVETPAPRVQYSASMPALKTKDAIFVAGAEGRYAVYDGNGYMTNPSDPANPLDGGDTVGGMLRFLSVAAANQLPIAVDDFAATLEDTPVDINVVSNDSDPNGSGLTVIAVTQPANGTVAISNPTCCVLYTPNLNWFGDDTFTYTITDGNGVTSTATANVSVAVASVNDVPVITSTPITTATTSQPYSYQVVATDADLANTPPDVLTFSLTVGPQGITIDPATGLIQWTPTVQQDGVHDVAVNVTDLAGAIDNQVFQINVALVNVAPVITTTAVTTAIAGQPYTYDVDATDADLGDTQTWSLTTAPAGMTIDAATGVIDWTPTMAQLGGNPVSVAVTDFHGLTTTQDFTITVAAPAGALFFSNRSNTAAVPGVASTNNANIYAYDGVAYSLIVDFVTTMGFQADVDGIQMVDADTFYVSFSNTTRTVPGIGTVEDEDILLYDAGTWSVYFDGTANGLTANNHDIDAFSIDGGVLYFSTLGNATVPGVGGTADDADIYSWNGASFARVLDASTAGLASTANIDGLTVKGGTYYMSFAATSTTVPGLGGVADTAVVAYTGGAWSVYFSGPGLTAGSGQDLDAVDVP